MIGAEFLAKKKLKGLSVIMSWRVIPVVSSLLVLAYMRNFSARTAVKPTLIAGD